MATHLIKIYHGFKDGNSSFRDFLSDINKTLTNQTVTFGLHYNQWELLYSLDANEATYASFESQFYADFNNFQIVWDKKWMRKYDMSRSSIAEVSLEHEWYFPFEASSHDDSSFINNILRALENCDIGQEKMGYLIQVMPVQTESFTHYMKQKFAYRLFRWQMRLSFFKYMFMRNVPNNWQAEWHKYYANKSKQPQFRVRMAIIAQSTSKDAADGKIRALFNKFLVFKHIPFNQFLLRFHRNLKSIAWFLQWENVREPFYLTSEEVSHVFHFPDNPAGETALLTVKSKKLWVPVGLPALPYQILENGEIEPVNVSPEMTPIGVSDYRSTRVPLGIYDEDRLRHMYVVGKTWVGKSKFLLSLMIRDIQAWKGIGVIDPHGDLINELITHIPEHRKNDVIIFDPTDDQYPFCLNPLDVKENESKQVLAKWFIDIFKKFFGSNWNPKLEHVLRMIFLALLDKPGSTLFDIIRALTDKDFRYTMLEHINDDVVRNFWTNEFAGWSQQFNTEAIMPILNKVGQLLSIDMLKNIFASPENKLDLRKVMDERKILFVKLPKGKLQEEIMWFLGAMFVTKIFQTSMSRQNLSKDERVPFFLYVDEFQNFATETFKEILSEARKYGLWLAVAHQFISQIPDDLSDALFGNVGTLVSFRISSEDAWYMKQHFSPFLTDYDLANLNMRELYCKTIVNGQVKDPFSLLTLYTPDVKISPTYIQELYSLSRAKYARSLEEAKVAVTKQKEVIEKIEEFMEPLL